MDFDVNNLIDPNKTYDEGCFLLPAFGTNKYYWKVYRRPEYFRTDVPWKDLTEKEQNILLYGSYTKGGERIDKKLEGVYNQFKRLVLMKGPEEQNDYTLKKIATYLYECECPDCKGKRLNNNVLECKINGYNIADMCDMEFEKLREELLKIDDERAKGITEQLIEALTRMIDIGVPYLNMNRESTTLSGGEAQRVKLVRHMGSSLCGMLYIFDEPSTGMHPRDVYRMANLLKRLRDKGNTVIVVEHDKDIIKIADQIIDVGPLAGKNGGMIKADYINGYLIIEVLL